MHSRVLLGLLVVGLGAGARSAAAQCSTSPDDTGFADVIFDPGQGTFKQLLPFDVPVRVCAEVPGGTTLASMRYAASLKRGGPLQVDPNSCVITTMDPRTNQPVAWSARQERVPNTATVNNAAVNTVRWLTGRLEAERYYAFCFEFEKKATDQEIAEFRAQARTVLDRGVAEVGSADLTVGQTQQICSDLKERLLAVTRTDQVLTEETIFKCDDQRMADFAKVVTRGVVQPQRRAQQILAGVPNADPDFDVPSLGARQSALAADLLGIQANSELRAALELLEQQSAIDAATGARAHSLCAACATLVGSAATSGQRLALGEDDIQVPAPPLTLSSAATQASAMATGYAATAANLDDLASLLTWMAGPDSGAAIAAGLSASQRSTLAAMAAPGGLIAKARAQAVELAKSSRLLEKHLSERSQALTELTEGLVIAARQVILADGSTMGNFMTRQANSINVDAGLMWAPELAEIVPYLGTNFYLRPVNKQASLSSLGGFRETFTRRFAFTLALTGSSIADQGAGATRDDLFASQSLLLGAGLRITDSARLGAGAIVFQRDDPNPLIAEEELYASWYLSLSFDIDVVSLFAGTLRGRLPANTPR